MLDNFTRVVVRNRLHCILLLILLVSIIPEFAQASNGAYVAYRSTNGSGVDYPKIRFWNSTGIGTFSTEVELPTTGSNIRQAVLKTSPISSKMVLITSSNDSFLDAYICYLNCTNANNWHVSNDFANSTFAPQRHYDFDFETATDDVVVVYSPNTTNVSRDLAYKVLDSNSLNFSAAPELYINDAGQIADVVYTWISIDRNPLNSSQELAVTGFDATNSDINAWIWNGSEWGNELAISNTSTATTSFEALSIKYTSNGSFVMAIGAQGINGNLTYARWNGSLWSGLGHFDVDLSDANDVRFVSLKSNPVYSYFQGVFVDSGSDLATAFWNDTIANWTITTNIDTGIDVATTRPTDFAWVPNGTSGVLLWDTDAAAATMSQRICNPFCNTSTTTVTNFPGTGAWITLFRNLNGSDTAKILGVRLNSAFALNGFFFNGSNTTNYTSNTLSANTDINLYESYSLDFVKNTFIPIIIQFIPPTDDDASSINRDWSYVNITVANFASTCTLNWSGTLYNMAGSGDLRSYNVTGLSSGTYNYYVTCNVSTNYKNSSFRSITVDTLVINVSFVDPTPADDLVIEDLTLRVNISTNKNVTFCTLNLTNSTDNVHYNLTGGGNTTWYEELAPLFNDVYTYNVFCEDATTTRAFSPTRQLNISIPRSEAFVAYRSSSGTGNTFPKIRLWDGSRNGSYGSQIELPSAGSAIRNMVIKTSPITSKVILVTSSDDTFLDAYVCFYNCTVASNWIVSNNFANSSISVQRKFDFDFESSTGDAIIVYAPNTTNNSRDLAYRVLDDVNGNFTDTTERFINDSGHAGIAVYSWVAIDRNPINTSRDLTIVAFDQTNSDVNAWIWNGSVWGNFLALSNGSTSTANFEALAVRYAANGSKIMIMAGTNVNGEVAYSEWNGSLWPNISIFDSDGAAVDDVRFISLKSNPITNDMQAVLIDSGADLATSFWNSTTRNWTLTTNIDTGVDVITTRLADFAWLPNGTSGGLVWDTDAAATTLSHRICSPNCNTATITVSSYAGSGGWLTLFRNRVAGSLTKFLGIRLNSTFSTGSFSFNGTNYTNYGDAALSAADTLNTYEFYSMNFIQDFDEGVMINFIRPTDGNGANITRTWSFVNVSIYPTDATCTLDWEGVLYDMSGTGDFRFFNKTGLFDGVNTYSVTCNNSQITGTTALRTVIANTSTQMIIGLISPANNTEHNSTIIFTFNVTTSPVTNVLNCSLIANGLTINTTSVSPVPQDVDVNISGSLVSGPYNWSIICIDENFGAAISEEWNISVRIPPIIYEVNVTDFSDPDNSLILSAGSTQTIYCRAVVSDPFGPSNVYNASATFYYFLNLSNNDDDPVVHYTNFSCLLNETTVNNKTFSCGFDVQYYANNGTWNCNITINNNQSIPQSGIAANTIAPLYAINLTDGLDFGNVNSEVPSANVSVNITNFGNMLINVSLQGYAVVIGDNLGMNCSDGTNVSISNIRF
ncbi:MAG TPA: hypothetical protein VEC16_05075, partial [Alphaproteobacteria bacterium]|nr:hypothetical protein [Alphaproteobacteria bacterium]